MRILECICLDFLLLMLMADNGQADEQKGNSIPITWIGWFFTTNLEIRKRHLVNVHFQLTT